MVTLDLTRSVHFAATLLLEGGVVFRFVVLAPGWGAGAALCATMRGFLRPALIALWVAAVLSGVAWVFLLAGEIAGAPPLAALRQGVDWILLTQTQFGEMWLLRGVMAPLVIVTLLIAGRANAAHKRSGGLAIISVLLFAGSLAWSGHGAATPGALGDLHLGADFAHLIAAGLWLGGLLPFGVLLWTVRHAPANGEAASTATRRFAYVALGSVLVVLASGIINAWVLVGGIAALIHTLYGRLLLAKIGLFLLMVAFASVNRLHLTPNIGRSGPAGARAAERLAIHSGCELALGLAILAIIGVLGMLPPPGH